MTDWGERSQVTISVGTLDLRTIGPPDGVPVLALHGFPQTSLSWGGVASELAVAGCRVIAPDQRGYSPAARPEGVESYTTSLLAGDVIEIADALGWSRFHLVGHDWGSAIGWTTAVHYPDRVSTLTAISVPHLAAFGQALRSSPEQRQMSAYIDLFVQVGKAEDVLLADGAQRLADTYQGKVSDDDVASYLDHLQQPGALTAALNYYRASGRELSELPAAGVPVTFIWSSGDSFLGRDGARLCSRYVSADYTYVELPDVSHWVPDEAPGAVAQAVLNRVRG